MLVLLLLALQVVGSPSPPADPRADQARSLVRSVDAAAASRCMGGLIGFANVPVRCTVQSDGRLGECTILSQDRRVLRYSRRFQCMAGAVSLHHADGSPATGRIVETRLDGASRLSR